MQKGNDPLQSYAAFGRYQTRIMLHLCGKEKDGAEQRKFVSMKEIKDLFTVQPPLGNQ